MIGGAPETLAESWPSPARLVSQRLGGFERRPRYTDHDENAGVVTDPEGLRVLVVENDAIEIWARASSTSAFEKVLHEPWSIVRGGWSGDELELCRADKRALRMSFKGASATWRTVVKGSCQSLKTHGAGTQRSRDGAWTAKIETRSKCTPVRMAPDDCTYFHDALVEGRRTVPKILHGGETVPELSPSGRFLVFQDLKGPLVVYDTASRALLPTANGKSDWLRHWILWLPDESAFGVVSEFGSVDLVSPTTGALVGRLSSGYTTESAIVLDPATGELRIAKSWKKDPVAAAKGAVALPDGAEKSWSPAELHRRAAFGKGTWALWDEESGKALRVVESVVTAEPSPSERFVALLRDQCDKPVVCAASLEVVDVTTGRVRHTLDLPGVSRSSTVAWLGAGDGEIVAIVERDAQLLRLSDGVVLHVEPPSLVDGDTPVLWTETGLVDGSPAELATWVFRPAAGFSVVAAASRRREGLWRDFRENKPLP
jgi:hypothetical protein